MVAHCQYTAGRLGTLQPHGAIGCPSSSLGSAISQISPGIQLRGPGLEHVDRIEEAEGTLTRGKLRRRTAVAATPATGAASHQLSAGAAGVARPEVV